MDLISQLLLLYAGIFWIRWSWLRYRSDQLMDLCWKWLVPLGLALVMASAAWVVLT